MSESLREVKEALSLIQSGIEHVAKRQDEIRETQNVILANQREHIKWTAQHEQRHDQTDERERERDDRAIERHRVCRDRFGALLSATGLVPQDG